MIVFIPCNSDEKIECLDEVPKSFEFVNSDVAGTEELMHISIFVLKDDKQSQLNSRASVAISEYANDESLIKRCGNILLCDVDAFSVPVHVRDSEKLELLKLCMREVCDDIIFLEPEEECAEELA